MNCDYGTALPKRGAVEAWKRTVGYSLLALYFFAFMEWLFFVTKPSFLSLLTFRDALIVLLVAPLPYAAVTLGVLSGLGLLQRIMVSVGRADKDSPPSGLGLAYALVPALFLTSAFFLMIDNMTYTLFGFGVVVVRNAWRILYIILFLALLVSVIRAFHARLTTPDPNSRSLIFLSSGFLTLSILCLLFALSSRSTIQGEDSPSTFGSDRPPDIFLISGDALEVRAFESYGNPIEEMSSFGVLGPNTVVFENSFANANNTAASTPLVLTGKYAATTKKIHNYRFFNGRDAYRHLPGLLRARGYRSIQVGPPHHVDSEFWGMKDAFDVRNSTEISSTGTNRLASRFGGRINWELSFSEVLFDQVRQRLVHVSGGQLMEQPQLVGTQGASIPFSVGGSISEILGFLRDHPEPVFAQLHSMLTRPPTTENLRLFEQQVQLLVEDLKAQGRFENSIIVIWSDHGQQYTTNRRLPMIVKFPDRVPVPMTAWNVQAIDIAPTILDYLGSPIPSWMEGRSLLRPIDRYEPIFSSTAGRGVPGIEPGPAGAAVPGGLSAVGLIACNRWYSVRLPSGTVEAGWIDEHSSPCPLADLPSDSEAGDMMLKHLRERGYDQVLNYSSRLQLAQESRADQVEIDALLWRLLDAPTATGFINLSLTYHVAGRFLDSVHAAQRALEIQPDSFVALNNMCAAFNSLEEWERAIVACTRALEIAPDFQRARNNLNVAQARVSSP